MIELQSVAIRSGTFALNGMNLSIAAGQYAVLMGGTGQGKTTILEAISGLKPVSTGKVILCGDDVTNRKPADRGVGYVPQDLGLFPTLTVRGHLEFALRIRRRPTQGINSRVEELAGLLGIEKLLNRHVHGLSGGEAQRVALGRALSFQPKIMLLDEPLNALDETTRDRLCELLKQIQTQSELTTIHVTHSRAEARQLADKLLILAGGQIAERSLADLDKMPADLPVDPRSPNVERRPHAAGSQSR